MATVTIYKNISPPKLSQKFAHKSMALKNVCTTLSCTFMGEILYLDNAKLMIDWEITADLF